MDFIQQISSEQQERDEICCAKFHTYTNYVITYVLLLGLRGVSGMDLLVDGGLCWLLLVVTCGSIICGHAEKDKNIEVI